MNTQKLLKIAGIGLSIAGAVISLAQGHLEDKKMEELVKKEVQKHLKK